MYDIPVVVIIIISSSNSNSSTAVCIRCTTLHIQAVKGNLSNHQTHEERLGKAYIFALLLSSVVQGNSAFLQHCLHFAVGFLLNRIFRKSKHNIGTGNSLINRYYVQWCLHIQSIPLQKGNNPSLFFDKKTAELKSHFDIFV